MNILKTIRVAVRALARNKMRSFLTTLGIIIGVGAVIAMVSIGEGARRGIEDRFEAMGTNLLFVSAGSRSFGGRHFGAGSATPFKESDAVVIQEQLDAVLYVSPNVNTRAQVVYGNKNWNTTIQGTGHLYPEIRKWPVVEGVFFDEGMVRSGTKVCVLGSEIRKTLFEGEDPIGRIIRIRRIPFRVIGVLESKGELGGFMNRDDMIVIPYTAAMRSILGTDNIQSIDVSAVSARRTDEARAQIEELLRIRRRIAPGSDNDFTIRNMSEIAESAAESTKIMTLLLGSIASISLLVGGIGIMNIMLVSVTERIREIGIRMAVGAKERDILLQFLIEAVVLCVIGGLIGIGFGIAGSKLVQKIPAFEQWSTVVSMDSIFLAFAFAAAVGIFFGFYPARKASKLDPIEALRYE